MKKFAKLFAAAVLVFSLISGTVLADTAYKTLTVDKNGDYIETQTAYKPLATIEKIGDELLSAPADLVVSGDRLYIADTGNARIVAATLTGEPVAVFGEGTLSQPRGLFVAEDGAVFVADPAAQAVFRFSADGALEQTYQRPTEPLYGEHETFVPVKVAADGRDNLYIVCKGNSNGVVQLSRSTGAFLGYFGANEVSVSLWEKLMDAIFTEEQKSQLRQTTPASISNIAVDEKGVVYTMTDIKTDQVIRKLNLSGNDMLETDISFEYPSDLTVGPIGSIYAATTNGYILEFNSTGDLLFVFGGFDDGSQRIGLFGTISAIAVSPEGALYVLDDTAGQIQTFVPTEFTDCVHTALSLYQDGRYLESKEPWERVLLMNNLFDYAHKGIAEAYYMEEDYTAAMADFQLSNDKEGYSRAFTEQRNISIRKNIFIFLGVFVGLLVLLYVLRLLKKHTRVLVPVTGALHRAGEKKIAAQLLYLFQMPRNPFDAYYGIKREKKVSCLSATVWYVVFLLIFLADKYLRGYIFSSVTQGRYSVFRDTVTVLGVLGLAVLCHYLICSITEGEASLKNIYCGLIYALMPYIVLRPVVTVLTHLLSQSEVFLINMVNFVIYAGCAALLVIMVSQLNGYRAGETVKCIFWTLFAFFVAVAVLFVLYVMCKQTAGFLSELGNEVMYHVQN